MFDLVRDRNVIELKALVKYCLVAAARQGALGYDMVRLPYKETFAHILATICTRISPSTAVERMILNADGCRVIEFLVT